MTVEKLTVKQLKRTTGIVEVSSWTAKWKTLRLVIERGNRNLPIDMKRVEKLISSLTKFSLAFSRDMMRKEGVSRWR